MATKAGMEKLAEAVTLAWLETSNINMTMDRILKAESKKQAAYLAIEVYARLFQAGKKDDAVAFRMAVYNRAISS